MILEKYQLYGEIQNRGYSLTANVSNESEYIYFAKWIKGVKILPIIYKPIAVSPVF